MKNLFRHWDNLKKELSDKNIMLFLDFDGTLVPIVENPSKALIPEEIKGLLKGLSKNRRCRLAIITGRGLRDIKKRVGLKNIIYSGNHGLEIKGPKIGFEAPISPDYKAILRQIKNELKERVSPIRGALLEDKGLSLSIHYRLVSNKQIPFVKTAFYKVTAPHLRLGKIKTEIGKKVLEVRPGVEWDKGKAVLWLLSRQESTFPGKSILPLYIGDDVTDEAAFEALKNNGLTIFVGSPKKSHAKYYLNNTKEVFKFLKNLSSLLSTNPPTI
jgi:trehalose-phosphatase